MGDIKNRPNGAHTDMFRPGATLAELLGEAPELTPTSDDKGRAGEAPAVFSGLDLDGLCGLQRECGSVRRDHFL